ncbi:MAG: LuxR C-terminal-related transcriptional regulator [Ilumatobacter sp.]|uniref:helix-turn-helix transcriptional regulator n=1 Tax=Ilumatobacter sp. TaxID=1967498 RepID=UPI002616692C|nr:helix-turn-helix transcriptional regulator [Ilumatobacter sp.]MDJ0767248.1 LuxR C-terminal-related transcriptional regulator [Ilumatobacter sp.]
MVAGTWPCVGRDAERARIRDAFESAVDGSGGVVVIAGAAGAGKSHLVQAALGDTEGIEICAAPCRGVTASPFGVVLEALGTSLGELFGPTFRRGSLVEAGAGDVGRVVIAEQLHEHLETRCGSGPVAIVIDDLHVIDAASAEWLVNVAERAASIGVALVVASRPPAAGTPAAHLWDRLAAVATSLELGPLADAAVQELAEWHVGRAIGPELRRVLAATGNVPLLVTALLEALGDDDLVTGPATSDVTATTSARLCDDAPHATLARLRDLDAPARSVLQVVALLQPACTAAHVGQVLGHPIAEVVSTIDHLERIGLVVLRSSHVEMRHDLYRTGALAIMSPAARSALHASAVEVCGALGDPVHVVAHHVVESGVGGERAVDLLVAAARDVVDLDAVHAVELTDRAMELARVAPRELTRVRVRALANLGRTAESEVLVRSLLRDANPLEEAELRRDLALALFQQGRATETIEEMRAALAASSDPSASSRLEAELSFALLLSGDFEGADGIARRAADTGRAIGDIAAVVAAEMVGCLTAHYRNDADRAAELADDIVALAALPEAADAVVYQPWFAASLFRLESDRPELALRINADGRRRVRDGGQLWMLPAYDALDALVALRQGELADAEAAARGALAYGVEDRLGVAVWCHGFLGRIALHRGDVESAEASLERGDRLVAEGRAQLGWEHLALVRAGLLERHGRRGEALAVLREIWELFVALGVASGLQDLVPAIARLAAPLDPELLGDVRAVSERWASELGVPTWRANALVAGGWVDGESSLLGDAAEVYASAGRRLQAASALRSAAELADRIGDDNQATRWRRDAVDALAACGAHGDAAALSASVANDPASGASASRPAGLAPLSKREYAVVELVAAGLTNSEIAEQLYVSRRTVESHVSAAYRKLDVANRVELARRGLGVADRTTT